MIWTYQDAVIQLLDLNGLEADWLNLANAKRAVLEAYREFPTLHAWKYLSRRATFATVAPYRTGTVAYDHTGGTYERQLTLTNGTWPSWAASGCVQVGNATYHIDERKSSTVVTLDANENPGADVAAGTAHLTFQNEYLLPSDYRRHGRVMDTDTPRELEYVSPDLLHANYQLATNTPSAPYQYTVVGSPDLPGRLVMQLHPVPDAARKYAFAWDRQPRAMSAYAYSTGTAGGDADDTEITGSGTSWNSTHVGSVIRFGSSAELPTGPFGPRADVGVEAVHESRIAAVTGTAALTLETALPSTLAGVKYTISDPVDLEVGAMLNAFLRLCELKHAGMNKRADYSLAMQMFVRELAIAQDADRRSTAIQTAQVFDDSDLNLIGEVFPQG